MDAKDVLGDGCEQMLAAANSKRHAELITRLKELVVGLEEGRFVASTPLDADAGGGNEISGEDGDGPELPATLTDDQVDDILVPLRLAMESKSPKVIRAALASLQRLVAHGLLSGDADLRDEENAGAGDAKPLGTSPALTPATPAAGDSTPAAHADADGAKPDGAKADGADDKPPTPSGREADAQRTPKAFETTPIALNSVPPLAPLSRRERLCGETVALICAGAEIVDEQCELECLKGLLVAVSSRSFRVHGRALLR